MPLRVTTSSIIDGWIESDIDVNLDNSGTRVVWPFLRVSSDLEERIGHKTYRCGLGIS